MSSPRPPQLAERWLRLVLPSEIAGAICGDLAEDYECIARNRRWPALWYYWEAVCVTARYAGEAASVSPRSSRSIVHGIGQDLRVAARTLTTAPAFTLFVVGTLALAIGVNTAIVSVAHAALLQPFPYPHAERLVQIESTEPARGIRTVDNSYLNFLEWRDRARRVEAMAAYATFGLSLAGDRGAEPVETTFASAELFDVLGVGPALGHVYTRRDDRPGGDIYQAVISHGLWQRRFGGAPSVIGQRLLLDMEPYTIVGVMPAAFNFPARSEVWAPAERWSYRTSPGLRSHRVIGRLGRGATLDHARAEMQTISAQLARESPKVNDGVRAAVISLRDAETGSLAPYFIVLVSAAGVLLLIACANVANLMIVRGLGRVSELAVRSALGMDRWRMLRLLLAESVLLGAIGGGLGLLIAEYGLVALPSVLPIELPVWLDLRSDATLLAIGLGLTLTTTVLCGSVPALAQARRPMLGRVSGTGRTVVAGRARVREVLTAAQVALSLVLLVVAGLLVKTALNVGREAPGFVAPEDILTVHLSLAYDKFPKEMPVSARIAQQTLTFRRMLQELGTVPGVVHVAGASRAPFEPSAARSLAWVGTDASDSTDPNDDPYAERVSISPEYFRTLDVPLLSGRPFDEGDRLDTTPVAMVSAGLAARLWPNASAVGQRVVFGAPDVRRRWMQIVGVVGDVKYTSLDRAAEAVVYLPDSQSYPGTFTFVMRTDGRVPQAAAVRHAVATVDGQQAVFDVRTMDALIARTIWQRRLTATLLGMFAGLALLLAAIGIYGVLAHVVAQRTREIGLRLALGARLTDVARLVARQSVAMIAGGLAAGLVMVVLVSRGLHGMLFGIAASDPMTVAGMTVLLASVAACACYVPVRRAASTDLGTVLRRD